MATKYVKREKLDKAQLEITRLNQLLHKQQEDQAKKYEAYVYCTNCMEVSSVLIPLGLAIQDGDCIKCRVRGKLLLVKKVNYC